MLDTFYEPQRDLDPNLYLTQCFNSTCEAHFHRSIEVIYLLHGKTEVSCGGETFVAVQDDMLFFPEYCTHRIQPVRIPPAESIHLIVPHELLQDYCKYTQGKTFPYHLADSEFNRTLLPFLTSMLKADQTNPLLMSGYIDLILGMLLGQYPLSSPKDSRNNEMIIQLILYLDEHYREKITLEQLAKKFGYSTYYFSKIFHKYIGTSFLYYLNTLRLKHIANDLLLSDDNIIDFALDYGFDSVSSFYRNFKKLYGMSPKEYLELKKPEADRAR